LAEEFIFRQFDPENGLSSVKAVQFHYAHLEMIRLTLFVFFLFVLSAVQADESSEGNVPTPAELSVGPKMEVGISAEGVPSLDGVLFSKQQLAIVFRQAFSLDPKIGLRIRVDEKASFRHVRKVMKVAKEEGIVDVVFLAAGKELSGENEAITQPLTAPESKVVSEEGL